MNWIADASLAPDGERKIAWVAEWMPVLNRVRDELVADGSVRGRRIAVILPVEPKTAYLAAILAAGGSAVEAAVIANYAAGVEVGKLGAATVTPDEVLDAYDDFLARAATV